MKPLRHLSAAEVAAAMPPLVERLDLAERTMLALGTSAQLPPKIGVGPRQPGSLAHAMPALLRGDAAACRWIDSLRFEGLSFQHTNYVLPPDGHGDPQAAVPYVWAELQALGGSFFAEAEMDDFGNVPEVRELGATWDQLESMSIEDLASLVVDHATSEAVPVAA